MTDSFNRIALDPENSVVIEACAGSGKTWLLVSRILRLLLAGVEPSSILAITFTRRAAQEMEERLRQWLRTLALGSEMEVRTMLGERALSDSKIDELLPRARGLFEACLTSPPVSITTFHGWFIEILKRAPLDSGLSGAVLVEKTSPLLDEAWQRFAEELQENPGASVADSLDFLFAEYGLDSTRKMLLNFLKKRAEWWAYTANCADPLGFALGRLRDELDVDPDADIGLQLIADANFRDGIEEYARLLGQNTPKDQQLADLLVGDPGFEAIWSVFYTGQGSLRKRNASLAQAGRLGGSGEARLLELHQLLGERLEVARQKMVHRRIFDVNSHALAAGASLLEHYQSIKHDLGVVDFTDVEWRVFKLIRHSEYAEYLQYKLDSRYKHILLDEFQDTNPMQWQVLRAWFAASNAAGLSPKVFMVGDPKQSIYRFRRAEAGLFAIAADFLEAELGAARLTQSRSRRNSPVILDGVNRIFAGEANFPNFLEHQAIHADLPGRIEVLPVENSQAGDSEVAPELRNPLLDQRRDQTDIRVRDEARQFALKIAGLVGRYPVRDGGRDRPARYSDIMALVRRRKDLPEYERALRELGIPYLGSSRGGLLATLEAGDLVALVSFLAVPFSDLDLARVLKCPIMGCSDAELMQLAKMEQGCWWARLQLLREDQGRLGRALHLLEKWIAAADRLPVHDLLDRIYFEGDLLRRYAQSVPMALKARVEANLNSFLQLALELDAGRYPSLQRFVSELAGMRELDPEESPDEGVVGDIGNAVRFYTVHGSKGLEAPIVWILGANPLSESRARNFEVLLDWPPEADVPQHFSLFTVKDEQGAARIRYFEIEAKHGAREDLNLLYVAMTRASQALFVSGIESTLADSWYHRIMRAAQPSPEFESCCGVERASGEAETAHQAACLQTLTPVGIRRPALSGEQRRGILLHFALQHLDQPDFGLDPGDPEIAALLAEARCIADSPRLRRFFDPGQHLKSWNELPYVGADGKLRRIDRVVEFSDSLWVLDYKTGEKPDPSRYRAQLLDYRAAMQDVFPDKPVFAAVIFRDGELAEI